MKFMVRLCAVLCAFVLLSSVVSAGENAPEAARESGFLSLPAKSGVTDYGYSVNRDGKNSDTAVLSEETAEEERDDLAYNLNVASAKTDAPSWYASNVILNKGSSDMLNSLIPDGYAFQDRPSRDKSPVSRYSVGSDAGDAFGKTDMETKASGAVMDLLFNAMTGNIFSVNVSPSDVSESISVKLRPIKNLILKFTKTDNDKSDSSSFEVKILPSKTSNLTFKTSDNGSETKTGIEFQMSF